MFITRKKFEAELEKARSEAAEKVWQDMNTNDRFNDIHRRIDHLCESMASIEKKMYEKTKGGKKNA